VLGCCCDAVILLFAVCLSCVLLLFSGSPRKLRGSKFAHWFMLRAGQDQRATGGLGPHPQTHELRRWFRAGESSSQQQVSINKKCGISYYNQNQLGDSVLGLGHYAASLISILSVCAIGHHGAT
jgi:hypothetical protein